MKIGILTFHRSINYGAFMQAYALANEIIKRYGDIVEIIDFEKETKHNKYKTHLYGFRNWLIYGNEYKLMYKRFQSDLNRLPLSSPTLITNDYEKVLDYINGRYDIIIVGSDAIWSYKRGLGLRNPYWLFGKRLKCIKMSYAASSYGLDYKNISDEDKDYIKECLESFSYIGVRDSETKEFIKTVGIDYNINLNCDPTILLDCPDIEMAEKLLYDRFHINNKKKIVSIMFSNNMKYLEKIIEHLGRREYRYVSLYHHLKWYDRFNPLAPTTLTDLSPYEWYLAFKCYYINITAYFHGTALALRSNVPTIALDNTNMGYEYHSKIHQLMNDLNLSDYWFDNTRYSKNQLERIIQSVDEIVDNHDAISLKINNNLNNEKRKSESFFNALDSCIN